MTGPLPAGTAGGCTDVLSGDAGRATVVAGRVLLRLGVGDGEADVDGAADEDDVVD